VQMRRITLEHPESGWASARLSNGDKEFGAHGVLYPDRGHQRPCRSGGKTANNDVSELLIASVARANNLDSACNRANTSDRAHGDIEGTRFNATPRTSIDGRD
jgi:hypothetical protein